MDIRVASEEAKIGFFVPIVYSTISKIRVDQYCRLHHGSSRFAQRELQASLFSYSLLKPPFPFFFLVIVFCSLKNDLSRFEFSSWLLPRLVGSGVAKGKYQLEMNQRWRDQYDHVVHLPVPSQDILKMLGPLPFFLWRLRIFDIIFTAQRTGFYSACNEGQRSPCGFYIFSLSPTIIIPMIIILNFLSRVLALSQVCLIMSYQRNRFLPCEFTLSVSWSPSLFPLN